MSAQPNTRDDPTAPTWPMHRMVGDTLRLDRILEPAITPCVVSSPPYNVAIPNYPSGYRDHIPWSVYRARTLVWAKQVERILQPGGRVWWNIQATVPAIPGEAGGPRINLAGMWMDAFERAGLTYRDTVVWVQDNFDGACAWGSWKKPSAPNLRGAHELILLYHKGPWQRPTPPVWANDGHPERNSARRRGYQDDHEELGGPWTDLVRNVWKMNPANTGNVGNKRAKGNSPAAFPIELPARAIRLSTWPNELVVDCFAGRSTTGWAAEQLGRKSIMVDLGYNDV